jgi:hypothetical protein
VSVSVLARAIFIGEFTTHLVHTPKHLGRHAQIQVDKSLVIHEKVCVSEGCVIKASNKNAC